MASIIPSPACKRALAEATALYPNRSRVSDGIVGDAAHQTRPSYHNAFLVGNNPATEYGRNPAAKGMALAFDLTYDLAAGCDAHALARGLVERNHPAVVQVISRGRIWTRARAREGWRLYTGPNGHYHHAHVGIDPDYSHYEGAWFSGAPTPKPAPAPAPKPARKGDPELAELQRLLGVDDDGIYGPKTEAAMKRRMVRKGSDGPLVGWVQKHLNRRFKAGLKVDNDFGAATDRAVRKFVERDGIVGPNGYRDLTK